METKKDIHGYIGIALHYFKGMMDIGGTYREIHRKGHFKVIQFKMANKMIIELPMTEIEYKQWRIVKPSLRNDERIEANGNE